MIIKELQYSRVTFLFLICGLLVACEPPVTMVNDVSKSEKVLAYLNKQHKVEILDLEVIYQKNAGNFADDSISYIAKYKTEELAYRSAVLSYLAKTPIQINYDTYVQELACLAADQKIEKEGGAIPFVIYNRIMSSRAEKLDWNKSNYPLDELQQKIFAAAAFQILVLVTAPDILENKSKYEMFHIEIMRRLKEQHIEEGTLEFVFLDDKIRLEEARTSNEYVRTTDHPIKQHTLQRWASIHKIKWYDMVKERPEKVLKYGKIFDK